MPAILALRKKEDFHEFKASLDDIVSLGQLGYQVRHTFPSQNKKKEEKLIFQASVMK